VRRDLLLEVGDLDGRLDHAVARRLDQLGQRLEGLARGLPRPEMVLGMAAQRLDDVGARLRSPAELVRLKGERLEARAARLLELLRDRLQRGAADLACHADRLTPDVIAARLEQVHPRLEREAKALAHGIAAVLERAGKALDVPARQLEALSHARVLERGYAIVRSGASGQVLPSLAAVGAESELELVLVDGELAVRRADGPARPRPRSQRTRPGRQGTLL
jgi:exodeoxyribonuclease VII large subunit